MGGHVRSVCVLVQALRTGGKLVWYLLPVLQLLNTPGQMKSYLLQIVAQAEEANRAAAAGQVWSVAAPIDHTRCCVTTAFSLHGKSVNRLDLHAPNRVISLQQHAAR